MNYRHAFHAGNFADLVKHAALAAILDRLAADEGPVNVVDTHAGAGIYDLGGEMAKKSGEGAAGIARLMAAEDAPPAFDALKAAVRRLNPGGGARLYPGSPVIAAGLLRPQDRYVGCELRPDDAALLARALKAHPGRGRTRALAADGYAEARRLTGGPGRRLVLIDPPFERPDDYEQAAAATGVVLERDPGACVVLWLPLKDLDTLDRFIGRIEDLDPPDALVAECRLRPLTNPMSLNGCALVVVGAPDGVRGPIETATRWVAARLGEPGGKGEVWLVEN